MVCTPKDEQCATAEDTDGDELLHGRLRAARRTCMAASPTQPAIKTGAYDKTGNTQYVM